MGEWKVEELIKEAEEVAKGLSDKRDTQLRKIFDSLRKVERGFEKEFKKDELLFLKPRLMYVASRHRDLRSLVESIINKLDEVKKSEDFQYLLNFVEAVIAYYKFYHSDSNDQRMHYRR